MLLIESASDRKLTDVTMVPLVLMAVLRSASYKIKGVTAL